MSNPPIAGEIITKKQLFNYLSIFFFSTVSLILSIYFFYFRNYIGFGSMVSFILAILFFTGYFYLFNIFLIYYTTKTNKWVKEAYKNHRVIFHIIFIAIFIVLIATSIYFILGKERLIEIILGGILLTALGFLGNFLIKAYKKYIKKEKN